MCIFYLFFINFLTFIKVQYNIKPYKYRLFLLSLEITVFIILDRRKRVKEKLIYVTFFKHFTIRYGEDEIGSEDIKSDKILKLLSYLLCHKERIISSEELTQVLWDDSEVDRPIGALKNLVYRLRTVLKNQLSLSDLVMTGKSSYFINEEYHIVLDVHLFEKYNQLIEIDNASYLYEKCFTLYTGKCLTELEYDYYFSYKSAYYHSLYLSRVIDYGYILESQHNYEMMEEIAQKAIMIDKIQDELHEIYIKALYHQGKYKQAIQAYKDFSNLLYRTLGTKPSHQMEKLYSLLKKEVHEADTHIHEVQKELLEHLEDGKENCFVCEYGTFKDIYNMQSRMIGRLGVSSKLCLITIRKEDDIAKERPNRKVIEKNMGRIQESLLHGLRKGDVISRFSANQFVVLLPVCNYEDATLVMDRLLRKTKYSLNGKNMKVDLSIEDVHALD